MDVWEPELTWLALGLLAAAWLGYAAYLRREGQRVGWLGTWLTVAGLVALAGALVARGLRAGHWPMASAYEFTLCFALGVGLAWLGLQAWSGKRDGGAFTLPIALGLLAYGLTMSPQARQVRPLVPALESIWFQVHVSLSALAYGAFAVGAAGGAMYLWRAQRVNLSGVGASSHGDLSKGDKSPYVSLFQQALSDQPGDLSPGEAAPTENPPLRGRGNLGSPGTEEAELLMWRAVVVGFPLMTAAILTGAIWAQLAWGRYWGWDLKEVWALLIWLVYLVFLHARAVRGWHGRPLALLAVLGFLVVLFTFLGTGWLARRVGLESLHVF